MSERFIRRALQQVLTDLGIADLDIRLERPKDPEHGDWATNVALTLAAQLHRSPRDIAQEIADGLDLDLAGVSGVDVAGPGFLNFHLSSGALARNLPEILEEDEEYGCSGTGEGQSIMVEFVSANPTGPLHLGHGRQAALGDAISSLLEWTGWKVHREFYYNDAGNQIELLARSVWARYQELLGNIPESYLELRLISEGLDLSRGVFTLVCSEREFSSLELGDALYGAVAEQVLSMRSGKQRYPLYLTGVELSGPAPGQEGSTIEALQLKKWLEARLNQALNERQETEHPRVTFK